MSTDSSVGPQHETTATDGGMTRREFLGHTTALTAVGATGSME